eukprot:CAMPEP_0206369010 /NCGR_PEP_ID=MMETSP0294-20121207/5032_1 /ASSEMBLY_ACC=CAM_ASM_000327 /TAXON_ID=39354 /ORGANISM="Heterosigma akashiwo, Strain CCMP2393" /LENGTH=301 /DNA_ID=CAMNT_0053815663 /DNA_START=11 /DNA_END=916 /DNA_ORIENTATION=+
MAGVRNRNIELIIASTPLASSKMMHGGYDHDMSKDLIEQRRISDEEIIEKLRKQLDQECSNVKRLQQVLQEERVKFEKERESFSHIQRDLETKIERMLLDTQRLVEQKEASCTMKVRKIRDQTSDFLQQSENELEAQKEKNTQVVKLHKLKLNALSQVYKNEVHRLQQRKKHAVNKANAGLQMLEIQILQLKDQLAGSQHALAGIKRENQILNDQIANTNNIRMGLIKKIKIEKKWKAVVIELVNDVLSLLERHTNLNMPAITRYNIHVLKQLIMTNTTEKKNGAANGCDDLLEYATTGKR